MLSDCAITGGGPAGLNDDLIVGRDHNKVPSFCHLFDNLSWN
jgi:hypothetical protein